VISGAGGGSWCGACRSAGAANYSAGSRQWHMVVATTLTLPCWTCWPPRARGRIETIATSESAVNDLFSLFAEQRFFIIIIIQFKKKIFIIVPSQYRQ
jgi:hypothetical protein